MAVKLGMNGKLYRNTGTYAVPVWVEITNVKDVTLSLEKGEADVTTRTNGGWRATLPTLKEASIEFEMIWDTDDEGFAAIQAAFLGDTSIEFAVMDGDIAVAGSEGLRATCAIASFSRSEPLEEAMTASVSIKPTYAEHAPSWIESAGGNTVREFSMALVDGAGAIDLTAIPYGEGSFDGTGKKVIELQVTNTGANALTISKAVANGYDLFGNNDAIVVPAGGTVKLTGTGGVNVDATHKALTLAGTAAQTSEWRMVLA